MAKKKERSFDGITIDAELNFTHILTLYTLKTLNCADSMDTAALPS
jgi:hypothetical protein